MQSVDYQVFHFFRTLNLCKPIIGQYKTEFIAFINTDVGQKLQEAAMELCGLEFIKAMAPTINPPATDFFTRIIFKAEMERICDEINYVSERLGFGIYLDSDYHKECVRGELNKNAVDEDLNANRGSEGMGSIIRELFESLRH